jgi:hypothetical protein
MMHALLSLLVTAFLASVIVKMLDAPKRPEAAALFPTAKPPKPGPSLRTLWIVTAVVGLGWLVVLGHAWIG